NDPASLRRGGRVPRRDRRVGHPDGPADQCRARPRQRQQGAGGADRTSNPRRVALPRRGARGPAWKLAPCRDEGPPLAAKNLSLTGTTEPLQSTKDRGRMSSRLCCLARCPLKRADSMRNALGLVILLAWTTTALAERNWSFWRGPEQNGVSRERDLPA